MLFWTNFYPLPLSHVSGPLKYVIHLGTPQFLVVHAYIHMSCLYREVCLSSRGLVWKVLFGVVFVRPLFCQKTSITTES